MLCNLGERTLAKKIFAALVAGASFLGVCGSVFLAPGADAFYFFVGLVIFLSSASYLNQ